jgi:hypothetical protein
MRKWSVFLGKTFFFAKTFAEWENVCNFAVSDCRQRTRTNCFRSNIQVGPFWPTYEDIAHKVMSSVFNSQRSHSITPDYTVFPITFHHLAATGT